MRLRREERANRCRSLSPDLLRPEALRHMTAGSPLRASECCPRRSRRASLALEGLVQRRQALAQHFPRTHAHSERVTDSLEPDEWPESSATGQHGGGCLRRVRHLEENEVCPRRQDGQATSLELIHELV